jgi:TonB family protein
MPTLQTFGMVILAISFANSQNTVPFSRNTASETSASPAAISDAADVALGEPFEWALPKYPQQALRARLQGNVVLMLSVDEEGYVTEARPTSGDPQLVESALGAVRKWKYVPYDLNGRGVGVTTKVAFVFSISETGFRTCLPQSGIYRRQT